MSSDRLSTRFQQINKRAGKVVTITTA
ncbi:MULTISPECIES: phycobilisome linker polypeptide [unclassified Microcoleus]|nr:MULTISPECIES: phycobilisome linker polypeptide [unclassified Microcoleus]